MYRCYTRNERLEARETKSLEERKVIALEVISDSLNSISEELNQMTLRGNFMN
jgi:hypothetical protein